MRAHAELNYCAAIRPTIAFVGHLFGGSIGAAMNGRRLVTLIVALAIGLGGLAFAPQGPAQDPAGQMAQAVMMPGEVGVMGDCEACGPAALANVVCDFTCPPIQFIPPPAAAAAFVANGSIALLLSSQRIDGLTPTPSPPPPRLTILV
jgi:hypothetical protein